MTVKAIDRCDSRVRPFYIINIYHIWQLSVYERRHCADSDCMQDTLSSRAAPRLAFRPSASREQRYLAYNDSEDTFPEIKVRLPSYLCLRTAMPYLNPLKQPGNENKSQPSPNLDRVSGQIIVHEIR